MNLTPEQMEQLGPIGLIIVGLVFLLSKGLERWSRDPESVAYTDSRFKSIEKRLEQIRRESAEHHRVVLTEIRELIRIVKELDKLHDDPNSKFATVELTKMSTKIDTKLSLLLQSRGRE